MSACEGQACGIGFVKIEPWSWGASGESGEIPMFHWENRCRDVMAACRSFVSRDITGNRLDEEAGRIWQLKTWRPPPRRGYESDGCVLKEDLNSGVRLKMFHPTYIVDLILNPRGPR